MALRTPSTSRSGTEDEEGRGKSDGRKEEGKEGGGEEGGRGWGGRGEGRKYVNTNRERFAHEFQWKPAPHPKLGTLRQNK